MLAGAALWGLHMGLTQGLLSALVADAVEPARTGTAFGLFHLVAGVFLLLASALAGLIWERFGAPATFLTGATISAVAVAGLVGSRRGP